jgi:hypothetical protein
VDTTAPVIAVDTTPFSVVDLDCTGDEAVTLPTATASDDCDGTVDVTNDAPATLPAGETTTVTFTAEDDCGNAAAETLEVSAEYGANIEVHAHTLSFGWGCRPVITKEPLAGITVHAFARPGHEFCSHHLGWWRGWHWWRHVVHDCDESLLVNSAVTDENGVALINVPPGDYIVITFFDFDGDGEDDHYLGRYAPNVDCGETLRRHLRLLITPRGKRLAARLRRYLGSELLIAEPDMMVWDGEEQEYPFGFESIGDWTVTTTVEPPEGFVSDEESLTADVETEMEGVQFTITEVGSDLIPTKTTFEILHGGGLKTVHSDVGIVLTPEYARRRGFNEATLRSRGLIMDREQVKPRGRLRER